LIKVSVLLQIGFIAAERGWPVRSWRVTAAAEHAPLLPGRAIRAVLEKIARGGEA